MCVVSAVIDNWRENRIHLVPPLFDAEARRQIEALRNEVLELKKLLLAAKEFDMKTGQPNCEDAEKKKFILEIANKLNIDLSQVFD